MEEYYFAGFVPAREGGYYVFFPDFPEASTQGKDFAEAMHMAEDALRLTVEEYHAVQKPLPISSGPAKVRVWWNEHRDDSGVGEGEFLIQAFAVPVKDMTPMRVNISLPKAVLEEVDARAAAGGMTRSGFLARAALEYRP